jgi:hypothetical protein
VLPPVMYSKRQKKRKYPEGYLSYFITVSLIATIPVTTA